MTEKTPLIMLWTGTEANPDPASAETADLSEYIEPTRAFGEERIMFSLPESDDRKVIEERLKQFRNHLQNRSVRYPVYILVDDEDLEPIRILSRLNALPYLGSSEWWTKEENEQRWTRITEILRDMDEKKGRF